jgi:hypothetical protein
MQCPITLIHVLQADFKPMTEDDLMGFSGVMGDGYIAEINAPAAANPTRHETYTVVVDYTADVTAIQVIDTLDNVWHWSLPGEAIKL